MTHSTTLHSPRHKGAHLQARELTVLRGERRVLDRFDLRVSPGERAGLIGANGAGKSTLLSALAGELELADGDVTAPAELGFLRQEMELPGDTTIDAVVATAVAPIRRLEGQLETAGLALADGSSAAADEYSRLLDAAEQLGLWELDARIETVLAGLQLSALDRGRPISELSGGQRHRLSVAALLLEQPTALLLDEPTNHLDAEALAFLATQLRSWRGPVLFASHDRSFLDEVATVIIDLDPTPAEEGIRHGMVRGRRFGGNLSDYLATRRRDIVRWTREYEEERAERARLAYVIDVDAREIFHTDRPRGDSRINAKFESDRAAKTVGGRLRQARARLDALDRAPVPVPPRPLSFAGFARGSVTGEGMLAQLTEAGVRGRLAPISLEIEAGSRLLVTGPNGAGKSTLLGVLAGTVPTNSGDAQRGRSIRMLRQDDEWPDLSISAAEAYRRALRRPGQAPSLEDLGLLDAAASGRPLGKLSYGQRRRVALAPLVAEPPALLLLDEPTNHLAIELVSQLESALDEYPGAVVIASHDRWLRERWQHGRLELAPPQPRDTTGNEAASAARYLK